MATAAEQVLQDFTSGLERARARCAELQMAVTTMRSRLETLRTNTEREVDNLRQAIADALGETRESLGLAVQEASGSADLARQLADRLAQESAEVEAAVDLQIGANQTLAQTAQEGSDTAATLADTAVAHARQVGEDGITASRDAAAEFTQALNETSTTGNGQLQTIADDATARYTDSLERTTAALQRDGVEVPRRTTGNLDSLSTTLIAEVESSAESFRTEGQTQVDTQRQDWTAKFAELAAGAREFSGGVSSAGENVLGIARAMTEGAETVTDAMDVTNVGLRTVVGIFDNMCDIMDDIVSFA